MKKSTCNFPSTNSALKGCHIGLLTLACHSEISSADFSSQSLGNFLKHTPLNGFSLTSPILLIPKGLGHSKYLANPVWKTQRHHFFLFLFLFFFFFLKRTDVSKTKWQLIIYIKSWAFSVNINHVQKKISKILHLSILCEHVAAQGYSCAPQVSEFG